jgi:hypothetical protein
MNEHSNKESRREGTNGTKLRNKMSPELIKTDDRAEKGMLDKNDNA